MRIFPLLFLGLFFIYGCKQITTEAPEKSFQSFVFTPEVSELNVPIEISISSLQNLINKNLTGLLYEDSNMEDDNLEIKVWKQSQIKISANGNVLSYTVPLKIYIKTALKPLGLDLGQSKEAECILNLKYRTRISIDQNWKVETVTHAAGFDWIQEPELAIAGIRIPTTFFADRIVKDQMTVYAGFIDKQASGFLDIKQEISALWHNLHEPISINTSPKTWLKVRPVSVSLSPIKSNNETITATVGIKATTETFLGNKPTVSEIHPLPQLEYSFVDNNFFNISVAADLTYEEATRLASAQLINQEFLFGNKGRKKVIVNDVVIYPADGKMVIKLLISGSLNGNVYFKGTPYFDAASQKLLLKDFDFDLDSKNKVLKSADWLAHGLFTKKISPYFEYDLSKDLSNSRMAIEQVLEGKEISKGIFMKGDLESFSPQKIILTENSLKAIISANGKASLQITDF